MKIGVFAAAAGVLGGPAAIIAMTLFACATGALIYRSGPQIIQKATLSFVDNINALMGIGDFSEDAPVEMLMGLLEQSLKQEIYSFDKFQELQHKMSYSFYILELFDCLDQMQTDLTTFRDRVSQLIPRSASLSNDSVLALDLYCRFIKDALVIVPDEVLQNAYHLDFPAAVEEYLTAYKTELAKVSSQYSGRREWPGRYGGETSFTRFLKSQTLELNFPSTSHIGRVLGGSRSFKIRKDQINRFEHINPKKTSKSIRVFKEKAKNLSDLKDKFRNNLRFILFEARAAEGYERPLMKPQFDQMSSAIDASLEIVRYGYDEARALKDLQAGLQTSYTKILKPTGETAASIFSSKLMRESMSVLKKTAIFAAELDLERGRAAMSLLEELDQNMKSLLYDGRFEVLPYSEWERLMESFAAIKQGAMEGYPSIAYPILLELAENKKLLLPQVIWKAQKQAMGEGEEGALVPSKASYLTGTSLEIAFSKAPRQRAFYLSPYLVQAFEREVISPYRNRGIQRFLSRIDSSIEGVRSAQRPALMPPSQDGWTDEVNNIRRGMSAQGRQSPGLFKMNPQEQRRAPFSVEELPNDQQQAPQESAQSHPRSQPVGMPGVGSSGKPPMPTVGIPSSAQASENPQATQNPEGQNYLPMTPNNPGGVSVAEGEELETQQTTPLGSLEGISAPHDIENADSYPPVPGAPYNPEQKNGRNLVAPVGNASSIGMGTALAIGGGAIMGAALLAQMTRKKKTKEGRK